MRLYQNSNDTASIFDSCRNALGAVFPPDIECFVFRIKNGQKRVF